MTDLDVFTHEGQRLRDQGIGQIEFQAVVLQWSSRESLQPRDRLSFHTEAVLDVAVTNEAGASFLLVTADDPAHRQKRYTLYGGDHLETRLAVEVASDESPPIHRWFKLVHQIPSSNTVGSFRLDPV